MATARKKRIIFIVIAVFLVLAGIISYRIYSNIVANKERAGRVTQGRAVTVDIAAVTRRDIKPVLEFSANLEPVWSADISAKVDGRIDRLVVEEGDSVQSGAALAILDTNELAAQVMQAKGSLYEAKANLEQAQLDLRRTEALAAQGAVSAQTLDTARIKRDMALGKLQTSEGNLALLQARLESATVVAPRSGVVVKRYVQSGFYTKVGSPIVNIADVSTLLAKASVGEGQLEDLALGTSVKVKVNALGGKEYTGTVTRISPMASQPARAFIAEISVPNDGSLKSGMFAKVLVPGKLRTKVLAVPESALVMREDQKTVFTVTGDNVARQKVIQVGYVGDGWAEVTAGIEDGERIVVGGQNKLKDGTVLRISEGAKEGGK